MAKSQTVLEKITEYYLDGYGKPRKYYTDEHLAGFVKKRVITKAEMTELQEKKAQRNAEESSEE